MLLMMQRVYWLLGLLLDLQLVDHASVHHFIQMTESNRKHSKRQKETASSAKTVKQDYQMPQVPQMNQPLLPSQQYRPASAQYRQTHHQFPQLSPPSYYDVMSNAMTNMTLPMHNSSQEVQQLKAKVALLERKIRMKDQLFDDSLSSSFAGCNGSQGTEYQTLIQKLKKKVLFLQTKNDQSEAEIKRLTKTVRVVEVEVQEDTQPLKSELQKLQDLNSKLLSQLDAAHKQIEGLQSESKKLQANLATATSEINQHLQTIHELGLSLKDTQGKYKHASDELKQSRELGLQLDKEIQKLTIKLQDKKKRCKQFKQSLQDLKSQSDKDIQQLKHQLQSQDEQFAQEKKQLLAKIKSLEYEVEQLKVPKEQKVVVDDSQTKEVQARLDKMAKETKELQHDYDKLKKKYEAARQEHEPCQERLELALKEIKQLQVKQETVTTTVVKNNVVESNFEASLSKTYKQRKHSSDSSKSSQSSKSDKAKKTTTQQVKIVQDPKLAQQIAELQLQLTESQHTLTNLQESHIKELSSMKQSYQDKIMRLEAEVEELYAELEQDEQDDAKLQQDAFSAVATGALAVKKAEDLKVRQGREIRLLNEQLRQYVLEITNKQAEMESIVAKNQQIIVGRETVDKLVKVERIVPQVVERIVQIETFVERVDNDKKVVVMEQERAMLKKDIRNEFAEEIDQMRTNILAYQDLLIEKETEIKAYAIKLASLAKSQGTADQSTISNLKVVIEDQQTQIENLKRQTHANCPTRLTEQELNQLVVDRVLGIEAEYQEKIKDVSEKLLKEIKDLQKDFLKKQKKTDKLWAEQARKHRVEVELKDQMLASQQTEFDKKSQHWVSLQDICFNLEQDKEALLKQIQSLEQKHEKCHQHEETKHRQEILNMKQQVEQMAVQSRLKDQTIQELVDSKGDKKCLKLSAELEKLKAKMDKKKLKFGVKKLEFENVICQDKQQIELLQGKVKGLEEEISEFKLMQAQYQELQAEVDSIVAKAKAQLQTQTAEFHAMLELKTCQLQQQLSLCQQQLDDKQQMVTQLVIQLESMQQNETVDDVVRRYKLQMHLLQKEQESMRLKYQQHCEVVTRKLNSEIGAAEQRRLRDAEEWKLRERVIRIELQQELVVAVRECEARLQLVIDDLQRKVKVGLGKIEKRDQEIRRLLIKIEEIMEIKIQFEEFKVTKQKEIVGIKEGYELQIKEWAKKVEGYKVQVQKMEAEYMRLKKEHDKCPDIIEQLKGQIKKLELMIEELKMQKVELKRHYSEKSEEEEKYEMVGVVQSHTDTFDVYDQSAFKVHQA